MNTSCNALAQLERYELRQQELDQYRASYEKREEDVVRLQNSVSTLTSKLKQQLNELLRLKQSSPGRTTTSLLHTSSALNSSVMDPSPSTRTIFIDDHSAAQSAAVNENDLRLLMQEVEKRDQQLAELRGAPSATPKRNAR